ncbi:MULTISPECIES: YjcZ family sporulation protein [Niallia]|uniref:YjcZ family sporulation protein n=2 Tax=Niallia TaxID=2837506 RepID=A0A3S2TWH3_9BACI|nr:MULTISPECIES: YjcZ family sporulation protein [Niallia]MCM3214957.1 YjcZ family sporulation protein [Niallia taxi]MCT2344079.1 YjcZ family sporulation protein [Niallia taxi]MDE5051286.1 YjcZ family sporulation protein [Niallia taxi]MDK8638859.1 YjcZ family sporulation protein [Niallia taxi]MED3964549.1 YjcZ family sporulation protein [Niallia taxi]
MYGYGGCGYPSYGYSCGTGYGGGFALIVVLFILLIIVGAACFKW